MMIALPALLMLLAADPAGDPNANFDFDLMAPAPQQATAAPQLDPKLAELASKRRTMLTTHQVLGLTTLGLMAATVVVGQLNYMDVYGDGGHTGDYLIPKRILGYVTTASFIATASFSLFAPTPYEKHDGFDTATVHKIAVGIASAGVVSQVVLGFVTARTADAGNPQHLQSLAKAHQVVGYTTFAAMATAAAVWVF